MEGIKHKVPLLTTGPIEAQFPLYNMLNNSSGWRLALHYLGPQVVWLQGASAYK